MSFQYKFFFSTNRNFAISIICALVILLVQMYVNTGTLSAYAVTLQNPFKMEGYIVNYDYAHYQCNYNFIIGESVDKWGTGWVLRRELFYIISFPFFKLFGFYIGGILSAFVITLTSFYFFIKFIYKNIGIQSAYVAMILLSTYPGIMYWIGSPFAQVMIVPCCCWVYVIMWKMSQTDKLKKHILYLSIISLMFTAYDLFVYFYPAILLIYLKHCQWKKVFVSLPIMIIPQILIILWLKSSGATTISSANSGLYFTITKSYFHITDFSSWLEILELVPKILFDNFLDSNFLFLPLLFLIAFILGLFKKFALNEIETSILFFVLMVFLFNNLAPWYEADFQMRGVWIARVYQPIFIVMLMYIVRFSALMADNKPLRANYFIGLIILCACLNLAINVGGIFGSKLTERAWYRFYQHSPPNTMTENLKKFGVRPIGFSK
jgi:hypothetical protein